VERGEVAGVIETVMAGNSLRSQPESTVDRSKFRFRLAPKTHHTSCCANVRFKHSSPLPRQPLSLSKSGAQRYSHIAQRVDEPRPF
jgi:hypothetical protein